MKLQIYSNLRLPMKSKTYSLPTNLQEISNSPPKTQDLSRCFYADEKVLREWVESRTLFQPHLHAGVTECYESYVTYAHEQGQVPLVRRKFAAVLTRVCLARYEVQLQKERLGVWQLVGIGLQ